MNNTSRAPVETTPLLVRPSAKARLQGWFVGVLIVTSVVGGIGWLVRKRLRTASAAATPAGDRVISVPVVSVVQRDLPIQLEGLGSVMPLQTVMVRSQVEGRLDRVMFKEGEFVHRGEQIAQIDSRPFVNQLNLARAALAREEAQQKNAKVTLTRFKALLEQKFIPQQQLDDQQALVDQGSATSAAALAQVDQARLQIDYSQITSPLDGVTGMRLVDPGNIVHPSDTNGIVTITQLDPIAVVFTLPQDDLPLVASQFATGAMRVEAFGRDGIVKLATGTLSTIDNQVDQATATIKMKAAFSNPDRKLWPSQFVKARLSLTTMKDAIVVPAPVVQRGSKGLYAYVVGADKTVTMRPIEVAVAQGENVVVTKGLRPGELVVTDGHNQLRPGSKVVPRPTDKEAGATSPESATKDGKPPEPASSANRDRAAPSATSSTKAP